MKRVLYDSVVNNEPSTQNQIVTCKISPESEYLAVGDSKGKLNIFKID